MRAGVHVVLRASAPLFLLLGACDGADRAHGTDGAATPAVAVIDSAGVRMVTITGAPDELPVWRLAPEPLHVVTGASTGDSAAFSFVGPVRWLADGGLVVADHDAAQLFLFDATGGFTRTLGRRGAGPGELRSIATLTVQSGDTITTWDRSQRRLSYWHPVAGYTRQLVFNESEDGDLFTLDVWPWQDSLVVVLQQFILPPPPLSASQPAVKWPAPVALALRDRSGRTLGETPRFAGSFSVLDPKGDGPAPFANLPFVAIGPRAIWFGSGEDFTLQRLAPDFTLASRVRWPSQGEPLTPEEVARVRDTTIARLAQRIPVERARAALANSFLPEMLPAQRPATGRVFVDEADRLWVARYEARVIASPVQPTPTRWTVLASDGTPLAALELPPGTRLEDVRAQRAVVVQRDSLDVEHVAVFEILR